MLSYSSKIENLSEIRHPYLTHFMWLSQPRSQAPALVGCVKIKQRAWGLKSRDVSEAQDRKIVDCRCG